MVSDRPGGSGGLDVYVSRRSSINDPWGPPQNLGTKINTEANDYCPLVTPDGHTLIFVSNRAGGQGMGDLYIAFRRNALDDLAWDGVQPLTELNGPSDEFGPTAYDNTDGSITLFYNSDRAGGLGGPDIYTSTLGADGRFTAPRLVPELSSSGSDTWPVVRLDGLEMFLTSNRSGTLGGNDLWSSTRGSTSDAWSAPVNLGSVVNTSSGEGRSWVYAGGTRLLFFSNRAGGNGLNDLYETTRVRSAVVPVVGSVTGVGGAQFKTFAQLTNSTASPVTGHLVFRPAGSTPSPSDPRIPYTLAPFETRTIADLMATFGVSGLGTLEILPTTGTVPSSVIRIENGGVVYVPQLRTEDVLHAGSRGVLVTPSESQSRMNIGIRTFGAGATITISLYGANGSLVRTVTRTYPANFFTQVPASVFAGGEVAANQTLVVTVDAGSAAVYGSTVSSTGKGSTLLMATRSP